MKKKTYHLFEKADIAMNSLLVKAKAKEEIVGFIEINASAVDEVPTKICVPLLTLVKVSPTTYRFRGSVEVVRKLLEIDPDWLVCVYMQPKLQLHTR